MQYPGYTCQLRRANWAMRDSLRRRLDDVGHEDVHLRNYDRRHGYDIDLEFVDAEGDIVFGQRHYLQPGYVESLEDVVPNGVYEVRATLDNNQLKTFRCRIDAVTDHTAIIEVGNGILRLTEGFHH